MMPTDRAPPRRPPYLSLVPRVVRQAPKRVVVLDDDLVMLGALDRLLTRAGFEVVSTHDPKRALETVICEGADALVSDLYMPDMTGNLVLSMAATSSPKTARVLLTNEANGDALVALSAPFPVDALVSKRDATAELPRTLDRIIAERRGERREGSDHAASLARSILRGLCRPDDVAHSERVAAWALCLGRAAGLSDDRLVDLELGALLHDIGEVGIGSRILETPGPLPLSDLAVVRRHPEVGATLLRDLPILRRGIPVVLTHHERVDGGGYPHGLSGNAIPIDGRVFQIADAYDAIRNDRPYHKGRSDGDARGEMARHAGLQFDRELLAIFADIPAGDWAAAVAHLRPIKESA